MDPVHKKIQEGGELLAFQVFECINIKVSFKISSPRIFYLIYLLKKLSDEDELQSLICRECHDKFAQFSLFKHNCLANDLLFRQSKVNLPSIKQEINDTLEGNKEFEYSEWAEVDLKQESNDAFEEENPPEPKTFNQKYYVCNECGITLKGRRTFKHHIKIHFPAAFHRYIKNFQCSICFNKYMTQDSLETHVLKYHNEDNVIRNIGRKPKVCHVCGKTFKNKHDLKI